ncbi:MFS transporter [Sphingobium sp. TKS]|uniref:MFS transporter n=1 Tax=Sphingobium sp. TKS TaxID=1315974 RepID=UPI000770642A|nr:MFS transporter [Sphingobium sp. TKS]AMK25600.1 major facilitator superfamily transporter [Sphingobium sp. TKS]
MSADRPDGSSTEYQGLARSALIVIPLAIADLVASFETTMIHSAFKSVLEDFGDPISSGWLVTAYMLVAAGTAAIVGRLGDLLGRKRVLLATIVVAVTGSLISALAPTLAGVIAGRAVQGVAVAILPLCFGLLREHLPARQIPFCIGLITAISAVGTSAGLVGGGVAVDHFGWRSVFWVSAAIGLLAALLVQLLLPASSRLTGRIPVDPLGALLFPPAAGLILLGLSKGGSWGWSSPHILASLIGGAMLFAWWVRHELRRAKPLIDLRQLDNRAILMAYLALMFAALGTFQVVPFFTLLFQQPTWTGVGFGLSATASGLLQLPSTISVILGAPVAGWLCGRYGGRTVIAGGALLCTAAWITTIFHMSELMWLVPALTAAALGTAVLYTGIPNVVISQVDASRVSEATGLLTVARSLMGAAGAQFLVMGLANSTIRDPLKGRATFPVVEAYQMTSVFLALMSAAAILAAVMIPGNAKISPAGRRDRSSANLRPSG